ncbi:MAG: UDP-3-O-[3-hydroxymyristoyl] N-acetylglucosamine deacetylase [Phycisphaerales bacterium]|nr:MAG: UDP-3-O-[3-hydroxymyristoyl] N-acetylglucosamine deacetylase [Phycisphaerales bacterium]
MKHEQTISRDVELEGRGLFTGEPVTVRLRPAPPHTGFRFVRTDLSPPVQVVANLENLSKRARRSSLKNGAGTVETVEHCLGACAGLGISNLTIELNASELPGLDGSSLPFVEALRAAGICEQEAVCGPFIITDMVRVADGDSELVALPALEPNADGLEITYDLDYGPDSPIARQAYRVNITPKSFEANIAPARTFLLQAEAEELQAAGLGPHLTYADVVVFGQDGPIDNTLRFPDECVRHKILDLLGDVALLGRPIVGRIHARKSGHSLNHELVRALLAKEEARQRDSALAGKPALDIHKIQRILPHRYPLLMIDRIVEIEGKKRVVGLKNVTINEAFFQGHYPGDPIMPGVLIIEALAQIGGVLLSQELEHKGKVAVLLSLDNVKFRRAVRPGDQLILEAEAIRVRSSTGHVKGRARVADELAAEAEIKFILTDAESH